MRAQTILFLLVDRVKGKLNCRPYRGGGEGNPKRLVEAASVAFSNRSNILTIRDIGRSNDSGSGQPQQLRQPHNFSSPLEDSSVSPFTAALRTDSARRGFAISLSTSRRITSPDCLFLFLFCGIKPSCHASKHKNGQFRPVFQKRTPPDSPAVLRRRFRPRALCYRSPQSLTAPESV